MEVRSIEGLAKQILEDYKWVEADREGEMHGHGGAGSKEWKRYRRELKRLARGEAGK